MIALDWLSTLIIGIIVIAIGYIVNRVVASPPIKTLGWVVMVIGAIIVVIAIILLLVMLL
jgi:hypothetical protein